ncbi:putative Mg(2+) transport ATPase [compost metagenome]
MNIKGRDLDEEHVNGQTTAAGPWMTAAIDFCAGLGREATAVLSTVLALIILGVMPWVVEKFERHDE